MVLDYFNWNVNPEIFRIGNFALRWYGLLFASGFFFGYLILAKFFKKEGLSIEILDKLTIYTAVGTIIGARLGHCLFYEPGYYLDHPIEILKIWRGGLASHGAAIGILVAIYFFSKNTKKRYLWTFDRVVIVVALAGFFIRTGNLMNSEIYGIETSLPWGIVFLRNGETVAKHPTQIYEALAYFSIFILLYTIYVRQKGKIKEGLMFGLFLFLVFTARFLSNSLRRIRLALKQE
jgi:phosphatidylglycerol:prolipoprotein diacylglycerol transferase